MKRTGICLFTFLAFVCCGSSQDDDDCLCSKFPKELVNCEPGTCDIKLSNGMWIGNINGMPSVGYCPAGYCYYNQSGSYIEISASNTVNLENTTCVPMKRNGTLCGKCLSGFGPAVNTYTYQCVSSCYMWNWVYYILAIYVPIVVMFLLILLCDVRLTTGAFNAFILFGQVISSTAYTCTSPVLLNQRP